MLLCDTAGMGSRARREPRCGLWLVDGVVGAGAGGSRGGGCMGVWARAGLRAAGEAIRPGRLRPSRWCRGPGGTALQSRTALSQKHTSFAQLWRPASSGRRGDARSRCGGAHSLRSSAALASPARCHRPVSRRASAPAQHGRLLGARARQRSELNPAVGVGSATMLRSRVVQGHRAGERRVCRRHWHTGQSSLRRPGSRDREAAAWKRAPAGPKHHNSLPRPTCALHHRHPLARNPKWRSRSRTRPSVHASVPPAPPSRAR